MEHRLLVCETSGTARWLERESSGSDRAHGIRAQSEITAAINARADLAWLPASTLRWPYRNDRLSHPGWPDTRGPSLGSTRLGFAGRCSFGTPDGCGFLSHARCGQHRGDPLHAKLTCDSQARRWLHVANG